MKHARVVFAVLAGMVMALVTGVAPATAEGAQIEQTGPSARGTVGSVQMTVNGVPAQGGPLAPCATGQTASNNSDAVTIGGTVKYGAGSTQCGPQADGSLKAQVTGSRFDTTVLQQFGGPRITARTYGVTCQTAGNGSSGSMTLGGVTGITVPTSIPSGYTVTIPGRTPSDPPIANVVLNELVAPTPADGSLTETAMHIKLFPQGGPASGDILVGSASCDPNGA